MSDKKFWCCAILTATLCYLWGVAILSVLIHDTRTNFAFKPVNEVVVPQLRREWTTLPFVDIISVPQGANFTKCPSSHPFDVVNDVWLG